MIAMSALGTGGFTYTTVSELSTSCESLQDKPEGFWGRYFCFDLKDVAFMSYSKPVHRLPTLLLVFQCCMQHHESSASP